MRLYVHFHTNSYNYKAEMLKKKPNAPFKPIGIVVHSTGANNPNLCRYVDYEEVVGKNKYNNHWNNPTMTKSPHTFIGKDKSGQIATVQILPYDIPCWGCGKGAKGSFNYNPTGHIQFEICEDALVDETYFNKVMKEAQEYCASLCKQFGFGADKIVSHKEASALGYASNHGDIDHWLKRFGKDMDWFRAEVDKILNPNKVEKHTYRIGTGWVNGKCQNQIGAFSSLTNAKAYIQSLKIYDEKGNKV